MTEYQLSPSALRRDGGTQPRAVLDEATILEYAAAMAAGDAFPPVVAYHDGETYWLADGFHRVNAALRAGVTLLTVDVRQGSQRDAVLYSAGVNATHGLRRTSGDKRRAVTRLLSDPEWSQWSDREIARRCAVHHQLVADVRSHLDEHPDSGRRVTRGGTEYVMQTFNIGQPAQSEQIGRQPASTGSAGEAPADDDPQPATQRDDAPYYDARRSLSAGALATTGPQLITHFSQPAVTETLTPDSPQVLDSGSAGETGWYTEPAEVPQFHSPTAIGSVMIHQADARTLANLVSFDSIDLVVTSPPYNTGGVVEYDGHADDLTEVEYLQLLRDVWHRCYRVMRPGARICVNVPFGMGRQPWRPLASQVVYQLMAAGFELDGQIVWDKNTTGNRTTWGSWRRPTAPALRDTCEAVIVAHKPGEVALPAGVLVANGDGADVSPWLDAETFMALTQDHWQIAPESATRVGHPAPFPVKLAEGLIRLYGWPGCTILDPFAGSGTVAVAALGLPGGAGCPVVLVDQSAKYCLRAADRVHRVQGRLAL